MDVNEMTEMKYTVEESEGVWFQLWWHDRDCVYSEDLRSSSREEAEKEAARIADTSSPLSRVMETLGCQESATAVEKNP